MDKQLAKIIVKRMVKAAGVKTQEQLAAFLGIQPQSISSNIGSGRVPERWFEIFKEKFGVTKEELCKPPERVRAVVEQPYGHGTDEEQQMARPEPLRMEVKNEADLTNTDMLLMTSKVLESNTVYRSALASNIRAFYQAVIGEDDMNDMRNEINMMRKELAEMKELIMSLKSSEEPEKKRAINGH